MDPIATFKDIYSEISRNVFSDKPVDQSAFKVWANLAYMKVIEDADYPVLRKSSTFNSVQGQRLYIPEPRALRILNMRLPSRYIYLRKRDVFALDNRDPFYITRPSFAIPTEWYIEDWVGVQAQPTSASVISCISSATEPVAFQVNVEGLVGGEEDREVITLAAGAPVAVATTKQFSEINRISKSSITTGRITSTSNAGNVTLSVIGPLMKTRKYIRIGLEMIPNDAYTLYYKYIPWRPEMVNDSDVPDIPTEDIPLIVDAAMLIAAENLGDQELLASRTKSYVDRLAKLREKLNEDEDDVPAWRIQGNTAQYPVIPGVYDSFLRSVYSWR